MRFFKRSLLSLFLAYLLITFLHHNPNSNQKSKIEKDRLPRYPNEWAMLQRTFPFGTADKDAMLQAIDAANKMKKRLHKPDGANAEWEFVGPTNIGGRISALVYNPLDPQIIYAGAATGGVFKSIDGGQNWFAIFDDQAVLPIGDIAIDSQDPEVIYVGTGEANGGHNNFPGAGLFKSTDGGSSWQHIGLEETTSISRVLVDPNDAERIFVSAIGDYFGPDAHRGIFKSLDGGASWQKILFFNDSTGVIDLVMNPQQPDILYATAWERLRPVLDPIYFNGPNTGIYKSTNGGDSWQRLGDENGLPGSETSVGRIGLAICRDQPENLYALYTDGFYHLGLFRSKNGGETWLQTDAERKIQSGTSNFSWYFGQVRVHPTDPEKIFVLDVAIMGSEDGGATWPIIIVGGLSGPHVDHHALAFHPENPNRIIDGNDGGIYLSNDAGFSWQKVQELPVTQFYHITYDPSNPERLIGGSQDNGTIRTLTGELNDWQRILGGDGFYAIVDPKNPDIIYAESQFGGLAKSINGGQNWESILNGINSNEPTNWSTPVIMDPNDSQKLYYGTHTIYKTWDGGENWQAISPTLTDFVNGRRIGTITTIAPAPTDTSVVYVGTDDAHVWVTGDAGESWREVSEGLPYRWVTRVRVDPVDAHIAYVTYSGLKWNSYQPHVFRTSDMGESWQDISNNLPDAPVNSIIIDPQNGDVLFVATDVGVYFSENAGDSWSPLGTGMPVVSVYDFVIDETNRFLIAGTHGRSVYRIDIDQITSVPENEIESPIETFTLEQNYPNPFNASTRITFSLLQNEQVSLKIFNTLGQEIDEIVNRNLQAGQHSFVWDGRNQTGLDLPSGVYFYKLATASGQVAQRQMVLVR